MFLEQVRLLNFRRYYGDHKIDFNFSDEKNVTIFSADNNSGKSSFVNALNPNEATKLYDFTLSYLNSILGEVKHGIFGADMKIDLLNDGPFTLMIDSLDL